METAVPSRVLMSAIAVVLIASCAGSDPAESPGEGDGAATSPAGSWVLVGADPTFEVPDDARVTLEVIAEGDAWQAGGTAACNSYGGTLVTDGGSWRVDGWAVTEMACDEPRMAAERAYLDALVAVDTWARPTRDELVLSGPGIELRFDALPPAPTASLTDTTWLLDGLVAGTGPDAAVASPVAGADPAMLRLEADGGVEASTGCRTFTGEWTVAGDEILLTTFGVRDDSPNVAADGTTTCDEALVAQESHVLSVLGDGFRVEADGSRLTLISRDGLALNYRAG
jgi:heat shock protein HslJ